MTQTGTTMLRIAEVIGTLLANEASRATKYVSPTEVCRITRRRYGHKIGKGNIELHVTVGRPNFRKRAQIKLFKKAKEPFPVKKIALEYPR